MTTTPRREVPAALRAPVRFGYARVSTGDQDPAGQEARLIADGCEPGNIYTDHGASGTRASRPNWDKLLDQLASGDTLVAVKLDRIGRSVANLVDVGRLLAGRDVALRVLDMAMDTSTPAGRLQFHMLAAIAEFERDLIVERTLDGQAAVRATGNLRRTLGGPPPLGFRDPGPADDDRRDWEVDPEAAAMLQRIAEAVLPPNAEPISTAFEAERGLWGAPMTDAAGTVVNEKMIRSALRRPASAGLLSADDTEPGADGPLDVATFRRLAAMFSARSRPGRTTSDADGYWLGPLLRCANCGNQLSGSQQTYRCANPHKALGVTRPCHGVSIKAAEVNEAVQLAIETWAGTSRHASRISARQAGIATERERLEADLGDYQGQMDDLMATRRYLSRARFLASRDEIARAMDRISAELIGLAEGEPSALPVVLDWAAMPGAERRRIAAEIISTPLVVRPGRGGARPMPTAERIDVQPYREPVAEGVA